MYLRELLEAGVRKVRLPEWNRFAYMSIGEASGGLAAWATVYDVGCPGKEVYAWQFGGEDRWEEWQRPDDYSEDVYRPFPGTKEG